MRLCFIKLFSFYSYHRWSLCNICCIRETKMHLLVFLIYFYILHCVYFPHELIRCFNANTMVNTSFLVLREYHKW
jgi:hypothetical protein